MCEMLQKTRGERNSQNYLCTVCLHAKTKEKQHSGMQKHVLCERPIKLQFWSVKKPISLFICDLICNFSFV